MFGFKTPAAQALAAAAFFGSLTLACPAIAADNQAPAPAMAEAHGKASPMDHIERRIGEMRDKLHITTAQEAPWNAVAQTMRDNAKVMDGLIKERTANAAKMTAVDDLVSYEKLAAAHEEGLKTLIPVFRTLYDGMAADQKVVADAVFRKHEMHDGHKKHKKHDKS